LAALEGELSEATQTHVQLQEDARRWQQQAEALRAGHVAAQAAHEQALASLERQLALCRADASSRPSRAELHAAQRRARALQRLILEAALLPASSLSLPQLRELEEPSPDAGAPESAADAAEADALLGLPAALVHSIGELRGTVREEAARRRDAEAALQDTHEQLREARVQLEQRSQSVARLEEALVAKAVGVSAGGALSAGGGGGAGVVAALDALPTRSVSAFAPGGTVGSNAVPAGQAATDVAGTDYSARHLAAVLSLGATPSGPTGAATLADLQGGGLLELSGSPAAAGDGGVLSALAGAHASAQGQQPFPASALPQAEALSILHAQREKLRDRVRALEDEVEAFKGEALEARAKAERLLEDNVKLFAKIRFLESYQGRGAAAAGGPMVPGPRLADAPAGGGAGRATGGAGGPGSTANAAAATPDDAPLTLSSFTSLSGLQSATSSLVHKLGTAAAGVLHSAGAGLDGVVASRGGAVSQARGAPHPSTAIQPRAGSQLALRAGTAGASSAASSSAGLASPLGGEEADAFEAPYRSLYLEAHDPFSDFRRREKQRQLERLSAAERITLTSSRFFLGNRLARNFTFFYMLVMHLLVFATLWHFAHVSHGGGCDDDHHDGASAAAAALTRGEPGVYVQSRFLPSSLRGGGAAATAAAAAVSAQALAGIPAASTLPAL
jgi:homeobox protein cut-like